MANEFVIKHGFISKGDSIVNGTISGETLNLTTIPSNDNSLTQVLVRDDTTGVVEYRDASTLSGSSATNTFVTGTTFSGNEAVLTRNDGFEVFKLSGSSSVTLSNPSTNQVFIDVVIPSGMNTYVTGGTYNSLTNIITLGRNDGVDLSISGLTDGFVTGATLNGTTLELGRNEGLSTLTVDLSSIDTNTFVTGTTFSSNQATLTRNDGVDVLKLSGGTNVTLSNPSGNQIKFDVTIPSGSNTFVTGFTYDDINTFTISDNMGSAFTASINVLSATTISATTYYGDGSNLTGVLVGNPNVRNISTTQGILATDGTLNCSGGTITLTLPTAVGVTGKVYVIKNSGTSSEVTVDTISSQTIDGSMSILIKRQYLSRRLQSNGFNWIVI